LRTLIAFVLVAALIYTGLCALLYARQHSMIYYPVPRSLPAEVASMPLAVDGVELVITTRIASGPKALIYFGGNGEDVSRNLGELSATFPEHALYLMHYRGYGGSGGRPSELALKADALRLYDRIQSDHQQIGVIGRSLGSGIALHVASRRPVHRLALVTPYDSIEKIAAEQFPVFPVRLLLVDKYRSYLDAPQISIPTLVLLAARDQIIPRDSSERLYAAFRPGVADLEIVEGAGHNSISSSSLYLPMLHTALVDTATIEHTAAQSP